MVAGETRIGAYRLVRRIGAGGMGEVYRAEDLRLGRLVALKRLKPEFTGQAVAHRRFATEARAVARLNHPHITAVYDFDAEQGFMILELVEGESLEAVHRISPLAYWGEPVDSAERGIDIVGQGFVTRRHVGDIGRANRHDASRK